MRSKIKDWLIGRGKFALGSRLMCVLLLFTHFTFASEKVYSQQSITVQFERQTLAEVLRVLKSKTSYEFLYNDEEVAQVNNITGSFTDASIEEILTSCLAGTRYGFRIVDNVIIITPDDEKEKPVEKITVFGKVLDEKGEPLPGVTIMLKKTTIGMVTDVDGKFKMDFPKQDSMVLVFSFVGMKTHEEDLSKIKDFSKELVIHLESETQEMDEVVVTGYANVKKESFTGSSISVKKEDLLKASPTNVVQALATFDPSFRIQKSNIWGSDPNAIPEIYIRGRSGIGVKGLDADALSKSALENNPNLPIFIMDGFEVSVQKVYDLDPNRVESINILKDAAATAMYGSRAANGVVVITTVAPKPGEVTISYSLTGSLQVPDLSDYNLANAREKLEIERLAGIYDVEMGYYSTRADALRQYNRRLARIEEGVDTDWLAIPLRNAVNHKHSLIVEGGNTDLRYQLELGYTRENGVMKGSYRENVDAGFTVDWRLKDKLQVLNSISYGYTNAPESPYGDFSDYAHLQPYERLYDENGYLLQSLEFSYAKGNESYSLNNPLYEAKLNNYNWNKQDEIIEQFMFQWFINDYMTLKGQLALTKTLENTERFVDPKSSNATARNGSSTNSSLLGDLYTTNSDATVWDTQIALYYNRMLSGHNLNVSAIVNAQSEKAVSTSAHYRGFPSGEFHSPNYAAEIYEKPAKTESQKRLIGFLLSANYTWNDIYLADLSVRFDGSSEFGSDQKWAPFWSAGVGLNVHKYSFLQDSRAINQLKLRASYGQTGKVNFPSYSAKTIYETYDRWYATGFGVKLMALGNKDLKWETTNKLNVGTDLTFWDERVNFVFDYYYNKTVDLITDVTLPSSSGFTSYKDNLGETLNKGFDIQFRFDVFRNKDWNVALWGNLNHNVNEILKISDALRAYNELVNEKYKEAEESQGITTIWDESYAEPEMKYEEGASLTSIFAVRSLGIDPYTGKELFLNRDGSVTSTWSATQEVRVGDEEPKASGSFGLNLVYKRLTVFASFAYDWGKQSYNQTLVDQVENADIRYSNVDLRVLTQRWQKPGDIAPLKDIKEISSVTMPTSRFVQDDNELSLSSLTLSYDFNTEWIRKLRLKMLRLELSTNDLFNLSTVKQERGTSYPFARTFNFSLRATF